MEKVEVRMAAMCVCLGAGVLAYDVSNGLPT